MMYVYEVHNNNNDNNNNNNNNSNDDDNNNNNNNNAYRRPNHHYIIKLGFTGVYIIFLISAQKHRLWVLVRTASSRRF